MKDMKKDEFLEEKLNSYAEGTETPNVDLSAAKRALFEEQLRRRSARRRMWIALASSCASLVLIAIVLVGILPSFGGSDLAPDHGAEAPGDSQGGDDPQGGETADPQGPTEAITFSLSAAETRAAGVNELSEAYGQSLEKLTRLGLSSNINAEYTLYCVDGEAVLLGTELLYSQHGRRVAATVYTDLSGGKYRAEELAEYDDLPSKNATYTFKKTFINGEYACLGNFTAQGTEYCVSVESSYEYAFSSFMEYLL